MEINEILSILLLITSLALISIYFLVEPPFKWVGLLGFALIGIFFNRKLL